MISITSAVLPSPSLPAVFPRLGSQIMCPPWLFKLHYKQAGKKYCWNKAIGTVPFLLPSGSLLMTTTRLVSVIWRTWPCRFSVWVPHRVAQSTNISVRMPPSVCWTLYNDSDRKWEPSFHALLRAAKKMVILVQPKWKLLYGWLSYEFAVRSVLAGQSVRCELL